jgi:hypothetical protein
LRRPTEQDSVSLLLPGDTFDLRTVGGVPLGSAAALALPCHKRPPVSEVVAILDTAFYSLLRIVAPPCIEGPLDTHQIVSRYVDSVDRVQFSYGDGNEIEVGMSAVVTRDSLVAIVHGTGSHLAYARRRSSEGGVPAREAAASGAPWNKVLRPADFPRLPTEVRLALDSRGCLIPQSYSREPHNAGSGSFRSPGVVDWYALCSRSGTSHVFVFWAGRAEDPDSLLGAADDFYVQEIDGGPTFSRYVRAARLPDSIGGAGGLYLLGNTFDGKGGGYHLRWTPEGWVEDGSLDSGY